MDHIITWRDEYCTYSFSPSGVLAESLIITDILATGAVLQDISRNVVVALSSDGGSVVYGRRLRCCYVTAKG
jgi:hypothetical protein